MNSPHEIAASGLLQHVLHSRALHCNLSSSTCGVPKSILDCTWLQHKLINTKHNLSQQVKCLQRADQEFMDRVNMYSSFYVAIRK